MPTSACPACGEPYADGAATCPACRQPSPARGPEARAQGWWTIRLGAPFWAVVSVALLVCGLVIVDESEAKGRIVLIAVGAFGVLASLAAIAVGRRRARRERSP